MAAATFASAVSKPAERGLPAQAPETQDALRAYADGVNAWIARNRLPSQYAAVQVSRVAPWTPTDSLLAVKALAFTLHRKSPSHTGPVPDAQMVDILRTANGRYGSTLHYLMETAASLKGCGIRDRDVERLVALARRHALT